MSDVPALVNSIAQLLTAAGVSPDEVRAIVNRILENSGAPQLDEVDADEMAAQR